MRRVIAAALVLLAACRGRPPAPADAADLTRLMDSLRPSVERATGLKFTRLPRAVMISLAQLQVYLREKFRQEFPGDQMRDLRDALRLFTLLPDSTDLSKMYLAVLGEQVAGFYDPDSSAFFGVEGAPVSFRVATVSHEMVHALQHQYIPLDSILDQKTNADRLLAAQAILEGQATLAMMRMQPGIGDQVLQPSLWSTVRDQLAQNERSMPVFAGAPRVIREGLVFPYLAGAEFMRWWMTTHPDSVQPYGARMPTSTEQILLPSHYLSGDAPVPLDFSGGPADSSGSDVVGDEGVRILLAEVRGQSEVAAAVPLGWGGDRYIIYETVGGPALVWAAVWDTRVARDLFLQAIKQPWLERVRPGYRMTLEASTIDGRPATVFVHAPAGWAGWSRLPIAHVRTD
ncbi:MAG: hypothetical protein ACREL4_08415 [Gemmatimonadales bacterium]